MTKTISATQARKNFFQLIKQAGLSGMTIMITHHDNPPVVMMSAEDFEGWMETLEIMSDPELMRGLREAEKEVEKGEVVPWSKVKKELDL